MPIFHKNRQNLQRAKTDKSQQILQDKTTENHSIFCQNLENAVEPKTKKSAFSATQKSTPINKKHQQKPTSNQAQTPPAPRKKFLKIFAAASLALITCATTLLAVAPFGVGAASAAESELTAQEKLAAGTLNLNPETDPTLFTTSSGLDIKFGGATVESGALTGYTYFQMGTYNGSPVNWVIIGRHSQGFSDYQYSLAEHLLNISDRSEAFQNWIYDEFESDTSAGEAIWGDKLAGDRIVLEGTIRDPLSSKEATSATIDSELKPGEVLVISLGALGTSKFDAEVASNDYNSTGCELKKYIESLYTNLGFTDLQKLLIQPQSLTNLYYNGTSTTENAYMFPLAGRGENFSISTYLSSNALRNIDNQYWLRSGSATANDSACFINTGGYIHVGIKVTYVYNVHPAFVLKLA